jgi:hypothetical protein
VCVCLRYSLQSLVCCNDACLSICCDVRLLLTVFICMCRHELFPGYKGQRPETPPDIIKALPRIQEVLRAMNIPEVRAAGVEADDVIGTLATRAVKEGFMVAIASPDKVCSHSSMRLYASSSVLAFWLYGRCLL